MTALLPVVAIAPVWLAALFVVWLPIRTVWDVTFTWFAMGYLAGGLLLFFRPVQVLLLTPLLGARRPTRDERALLETSWRSVLQANDVPRHRYVLAVLPSDELNAFACGGHLVVVTTFAIDALPRDELTGVLAHELSHHLGFHTIALTIGQWLSVPVLALARVGFFLQNVATAATGAFAKGSSGITAIGRLIAAMLTVISWVFLSALLISNGLANAVGRTAEFQADRRVVGMGLGRPLANALRRVIVHGGGERPSTFAERIASSHPSALTRVTRIEALLRTRR